MSVAAAEWRRSSVWSKGIPGSHDRDEKAAVAIIEIPKTACEAAANLPQLALLIRPSANTPRPKKRKPSRASQAPSTPWAADSLVVCETHE